MVVAIGIVSATIAVLSAIFSAVFAHRSNKLAERTAQEAYLERVRDWADTTVETAVAITRLCRKSCAAGEFAEAQPQLRTALSAQIEKGRWFFPNVLQERVGTRKEAAYRGLRQPILDALIEIYDAVDEVAWEDRRPVWAKALSGQRAFVSEVQARLDPNRRDTAYEQLVERYREYEALVDQW